MFGTVRPLNRLGTRLQSGTKTNIFSVCLIISQLIMQSLNTCSLKTNIGYANALNESMFQGGRVNVKDKFLLSHTFNHSILILHISVRRVIL